MLDNWTLCTLTIPSRDKNVRMTLNSLNDERVQGLNVNVLYNWPLNNETRTLSNNLSKDYQDIKTMFYDSQYYGISEGRNHLLKSVKTPLIAFVDDDCSFEGKQIFSKLEETLKNTSVALLGLPSYEKSSNKLVKPRKEAPQKKINGLLYTYIEGMFGAGYTQLLKDYNGFNERLRFWGEWMDLNTKLHRAGFPTAIDMNVGSLRHWEGSGSPTRDKEDRILDILYGLLEFSKTFDHNLLKQPKKPIKLVEQKYFKPYKEKDLSTGFLVEIAKVTTQRLLPNQEEIEKYKSFLNSLPFNFTHLGVQTKEDWMKLIKHSENKIKMYKKRVWEK